MKITDFAAQDSPCPQVSALVVWEDTGREPTRLVAEAEGYSGTLRLDPNGFLAAAILPAWHGGERRVRVEGPICPVLRDNLRAATAALEEWWPELGDPPALELAGRLEAQAPSRGQALSLLSGGIDSLTTLQCNRLNLPRDHPLSIAATVSVDIVREPGLTTEETARQHRKRQAVARAVGMDTGTEPISIRWNALDLDSDGWFFNRKWHGAVYCSPSHFLAGRFHRAYFSSSTQAPANPGWGSHPMLDEKCGSACLAIDHYGSHLNRMAKVRIVADWPVGLNNILVCQGDDSGDTNCGACGKCIRTMTALAAVGKLQESRAFPLNDVTPELLDTLRTHPMTRGVSVLYEDMLLPLAQAGRRDLVTALERLIDWAEERRTAHEALVQNLVRSLPAGEPFVLVDDEHPSGGEIKIGGTPTRVWGQPRDDDTALRELAALKRTGVKYLAIRHDSLWWLDYYPKLGQYLSGDNPRVVETQDFTVYDVGAGEPGGQR